MLPTIFMWNSLRNRPSQAQGSHSYQRTESRRDLCSGPEMSLALAFRIRDSTDLEKCKQQDNHSSLLAETSKI
jgi:hypothetical protein